VNAWQDVIDWIAAERGAHAGVKYAEPTAQRQALVVDLQEHPHLDGEWEVFIGNYLRRAQLLGLDSLPGRQAMGKTIVTLIDCLRTAVEMYGPMPQAGVPSGEIVEWVKP
jgi:hypothetical protein